MSLLQISLLLLGCSWNVKARRISKKTSHAMSLIREVDAEAGKQNAATTSTEAEVYTNDREADKRKSTNRSIEVELHTKEGQLGRQFWGMPKRQHCGNGCVRRRFSGNCVTRRRSNHNNCLQVLTEATTDFHRAAPTALPTAAATAANARIVSAVTHRNDAGTIRSTEEPLNIDMSCKAWKSLRHSYLKPPLPSEQARNKAWNFCRYFSIPNLLMVNADGDREMYFQCRYQPNGAFRFEACLLHNNLPLCKLSLKYVHEVLTSRGGFDFALTNPDAEFYGREWQISGAIRFHRPSFMTGWVGGSKGGNRSIELVGGKVSFTFPDQRTQTFYLKESFAAHLAWSTFDAKEIPGVDIPISVMLCPALNAGEFKFNPCKLELESMIRNFCETIHIDNLLYLKGTRNNTVSFACVLNSDDRWDTATLRAVFTVYENGQPSQRVISSKWLLFDYMDLEDPTRFKIELDTDAYTEACITVDIEEEGYRNGFVRYLTRRDGKVQERFYA